MSISAECPCCRSLNSVDRNSCTSCNKKIPAMHRKLWARFRAEGHSRKVFLGAIPLREAREIERKLVMDSKEPAPGSEMTWSQVVRKFFLKLSAEDSSQSYQRDSRRYLDRMTDFWGDIPITRIDANLVKEFRLKLRQSGLSPASCDRHHAAGKAAWNNAVDFLPNPFSKVKLYNPDNTVERFLTPEQRTRLLECARKINSTLFEILVVSMSTGFRKSEVLNLRRSQVNFETGVISIRQKGNLSHTSFMNSTCRKTLESIAENGTDYFWISKRGDKPYAVDWRRPWKRAKAMAGIPEDFRWHDLRHDVATAVYQATHDLHAVQRFLGHRQISTTQRYAHTLPSYLQQISEKIDLMCPTGVPSEEKE